MDKAMKDTNTYIWAREYDYYDKKIGLAISKNGDLSIIINNGGRVAVVPVTKEIVKDFLISKMIAEYVGIEVIKENEELKKKVKTYEGRLGHLESCLPKLQHFNQKQRVRKDAFNYAIKIMRGDLDNEILS